MEINQNKLQKKLEPKKKNIKYESSLSECSLYFSESGIELENCSNQMQTYTAFNIYCDDCAILTFELCEDLPLVYEERAVIILTHFYLL